MIQAELEVRQREFEAAARKLEEDTRQAQTDLEERKQQAQAELENQKRQAELKARELAERQRQVEAELKEQKWQAHAKEVKLEENFRKVQVAARNLEEEKLKAQSDLSSQKRQAQAEAMAAGLADLTLDPVRLLMDLSLPLLGSGRSADTRRGTYRFHGKADAADVALKVFRGGRAVSGAVRDQILQEVRIGARLQHENLVRLFGTIEVPEYGMVLVMELASGGSLRDVLSNLRGHPSIGWPIRVRWLTEIAQGMAHLHSLLPRAIVHRDLKSANVLLSSVDPQIATAKICDFGLAKAAMTVRMSESGGETAGTFSWKAPETFRGHYTTKSDIYSFAVVGFEVVTRATPFDGLGEPEIADKLRSRFDPQARNILRLVELGVSTVDELHAEWLEDNPLDDRRPDLLLSEPGCPEALCALIRRCWADEPTERPEFSESLTELKAIELPRTFASSNFKREYAEAGRVPITHATQVLGDLVTFVHAYCHVHGLDSQLEQVAANQFVERLQHAVAKHHRDLAMAAVLGEVGATAELLWTSAETFIGMNEHAKEFSSLLNAAIRSDAARLMPSTAMLVRAINALCVAGRKGEARVEFPPNGRTFRGTAFNSGHRDFFVPGKKYRVPGFLATSFDETTARGFASRKGLDLGKPAVLWEVHVDPAGEHDRARRCKHVNYVRKSLVDGEKEYLFTAYSVFTVLNVDWSDDDMAMSRIELEAALDNSAEDEGLPLAPWY